MDWRAKHAINPWHYLGINPAETQMGNLDRLRRMLIIHPSPLQNLLPRSGLGESQQAHPYTDTTTKQEQRERNLYVPAHYYSTENRE